MEKYFACMYVCCSFVCQLLLEVKKRVVSPLVLELEWVVRHHVVSGNRNKVIGGPSDLKQEAISPAP